MEIRVFYLPLEIAFDLFLNTFSRLKSIDKLLFFSLHASYFFFVHYLLVLLSLQFFLNLDLDLILTLKHVLFASLSSVLLLAANHLLHLLGTRFLSCPLLLNPALDSFLFELGFVGLATRVVDSFYLFGLGSLFLLLLGGIVLVGFGLILGLFLHPSKLLLLIHFVVTFSLLNDLICPFTCFFYLLPRLAR